MGCVQISPLVLQWNVTVPVLSIPEMAEIALGQDAVFFGCMTKKQDSPALLRTIDLFVSHYERLDSKYI